MTPSLAGLIEKLKEAAAVATQGPWRSVKNGRTYSVVHGPSDMTHGYAISLCQTMSLKSQNNSAYIALANPQNILALIEELERLNTGDAR
jgi:Ead/Ea22-like protein